MADAVRLTFLGTGTSHGIPVIGCTCRVCRSTDPRDQRYRPSVAVEWQGKRLLVDTPPELRLQLIRAGIGNVDALLFTHTHADHVFGLDDVRVFNQRSGTPLPVYGTAQSLTNLRQQFYYAFVETQVGGGKPELDLREIAPIDEPFLAAGLPVQPVPIFHGSLQVLGFRFGNLAYVTDTNRIPEASLALLTGLDVLVLDALRVRPHPTHFNISEALQIVDQLQPKRTFFTHICHDLEHAETNRTLPARVELAYDGLVVESSADVLV